MSENLYKVTNSYKECIYFHYNILANKFFIFSPQEDESLKDIHRH